MPLEVRHPACAITRTPFVAAAVLAWLAVLVGSSIEWWVYGAATALLLISGGLSLGRRARELGQLPASLTFLAAVALLRHSAGGTSSGVGVLALIPVFYVALYGRGRNTLYVVLAAVAVVFLVPIALIGSPGYPHAQYRGSLLTVMVCSMIGLATQHLVATVRAQAADAGRRERMLEQVGAVVRDLFASLEPRTDICRATLEISDATVAILFEHEPVTGAMRSTAMAGTEAVESPIVVGADDAIAAVMRSGRARLLTEPLTRPVAGDEVWEACAHADSILYQPLMRGDAAVGVLVVGWERTIAVTAARETVVELLAHEAALVMDRADALNALTDMAETDPLTGLPNRRAWDARLQSANGEELDITIAMLDIDHFKRFNDTYGHPAGDRLLRETAIAWRDLLRADDVLARLGGEEFGLLLVDCTPDAAAEVTERLRRAVTDGQTASAGLAVRRPGESLDCVLGRADHALYQAKAFGRDHARTAA